MARTKIGTVKAKGGNSGKAVNRTVRVAKVRRGAVRKPRVNLSNVYGFMNRGTGDNLQNPGGLKGAVTQNKVANKTYKRAKRSIKG